METWFNLDSRPVSFITDHHWKKIDNLPRLICSSRNLCTKTNAFIVSLAVADFCVVVERNFFSIFLRHYKNACHWSQHLLSWVSFMRWLFSNTSVRWKLIQFRTRSFDSHRLSSKVHCFNLWLVVELSIKLFSSFVVFRFSFRFSLKTSLVIAPFNWLYVISFEILPCALIIIITSFLSMIFHVGKHDRSAWHT